VTLVDDATDEHHPARKFSAGCLKSVRLLELELAALLEALDDRVLELELADKPKAIGKAVRKKQDETVEIQDRRASIRRPIQVEIHVA
jgi:hypothetical protein